jgi:hypothetical protein
MNQGSGTGVSPVCFDSNGPEVRATTGAMGTRWNALVSSQSHQTVGRSAEFIDDCECTPCYRHGAQELLLRCSVQNYSLA